MELINNVDCLSSFNEVCVLVNLSTCEYDNNCSIPCTPESIQHLTQCVWHLSQAHRYHVTAKSKLQNIDKQLMHTLSTSNPSPAPKSNNNQQNNSNINHNHNNNNNNNTSSSIPPSLLPMDDTDDIDIYATTTNTIPCDKCSKQIPADQYETHQLQHLDDHLNPTTNTNSNPNLMVECQYSDCKTKWIPKHEYQDHLTLHQLQGQQIPNTSNDAMIAFNHQTQLLQQHTAQTAASNPDPRRICMSQAFDHLSGSQRPVIPLNDPLSYTMNHSVSSNTNDIPSRDNHNVNGIIESIDHVLSNRGHIEYYLCDPLQFFYRDREDYSWGCGFRNMQTLSSCLILKKNPRDINGRQSGIYNKILFNGIGYVPIIEQLQRYLDYAHAQGFDPEGLKELGQTEGRRVWIGAVDVAATLRSFYIPASIFDFQLKSQELYHNDLFDWVWDYFKQRYQYHGLRHRTLTGSGSNKNKNKITSYFAAASSVNNNGNSNTNNKQNDDNNEKKKSMGFNTADYGGFGDEDEMLAKALEMSKQAMEMENDNDDKKKKRNGKMEMDDDSDSGSSFSDELEVHHDKENDDNNNEEEKKSDENEDDLFYWENSKEETKMDPFQKNNDKQKYQNDGWEELLFLL